MRCKNLWFELTAVYMFPHVYSLHELKLVRFRINKQAFWNSPPPPLFPLPPESVQCHHDPQFYKATDIFSPSLSDTHLLAANGTSTVAAEVTEVACAAPGAKHCSFDSSHAAKETLHCSVQRPVTWLRRSVCLYPQSVRCDMKEPKNPSESETWNKAITNSQIKIS